MHLRQLELSLRANSARQRGIANHIAKSLSVAVQETKLAIASHFMCLQVWDIHCWPGQDSWQLNRRTRFIPFGFGLLEGHALVVIPNQAGINKSRKIELLRAKEPCHFRHFRVVD